MWKEFVVNPWFPGKMPRAEGATIGCLCLSTVHSAFLGRVWVFFWRGEGGTLPTLNPSGHVELGSLSGSTAGQIAQVWAIRVFWHLVTVVGLREDV